MQVCGSLVDSVKTPEPTTPACWAAVALVLVEPFLCGGSGEIIREGAATGGSIDLHKSTRHLASISRQVMQ